jgi:hypothetical protein
MWQPAFDGYVPRRDEQRQLGVRRDGVQRRRQCGGVGAKPIANSAVRSAAGRDGTLLSTRGHEQWQPGRSRELLILPGAERRQVVRHRHDGLGYALDFHGGVLIRLQQTTANILTRFINAANDPPVAGNDNHDGGGHAADDRGARRAQGRHRPNSGTTLRALLATNAAHGTVTLNQDGSFTYARRQLRRRRRFHVKRTTAASIRTWRRCPVVASIEHAPVAPATPDPVLT